MSSDVSSESFSDHLDVPLITAADKGVDHSYCLNEDYQQLSEKYNKLKTESNELKSLFESIKQKMIYFLKHCVCDSNGRTDLKTHLLELFDEIHTNSIDMPSTDGSNSEQLSQSTTNDTNIKTNISSIDANERTRNKSNEESTLPLIDISDTPQTSIPIIILTNNSKQTITDSLNKTIPKKDSNPKNTTNSMDRYNTGVNYTFDYLPGVPKQFQCCECAKVFDTHKKRSTHERNCIKNAKKQYIFCKHLYCKKRFISEDAFRKHMDKHLGIDTEMSGNCGKRPEEESYFKKKNRDKRFKCDWNGCEKMFALECIRKQHINSVHLQIKRHECVVPGCQQKFGKKSDLEKHMGSEHGLKLYKCQWTGCTQQFSTRTHLARHHSLMHLKIKRFKCDECDQTFSNSLKVAAHKSSAHNALKRFACDWTDCQYTTNTKKSLVEHRCTHTGERPHICLWPGCDRRFTHSYGLKTHTRTHTGEKPFKCDQQNCDKEYRYWNDLRQHKKKIHSLEV